jgi:hypothetical protein
MYSIKLMQRIFTASIVSAFAIAGLFILSGNASANPSDGSPAIVDGGSYTFTAQNSGLNLDVDAGSGENGAAVQLWTPNGLQPQSWILHIQTDGEYLIQNQQSGKYLDVDANSSTDGARIQQWESTGCDCQHWFLDYQSSGYFTIREAGDGKVFTVPNDSTTAGTALAQSTDIGSAAQRWKLTQVADKTVSDGTPFQWGPAYLIQDQPNFTDAGTDAQGLRPGVFGSQFPRMTRLSDGSWIIAYTIYSNDGYNHDSSGGMQIQFKISSDNGRTWVLLSTLAEPGRDIEDYS